MSARARTYLNRGFLDARERNGRDTGGGPDPRLQALPAVREAIEAPAVPGGSGRRERRLRARRLRRQRMAGLLVLLVAAGAVVILLSMQRGSSPTPSSPAPERARLGGP